MPKIEITDIDGKVRETTTAEIEKVTPYCPYKFPDRRCGRTGAKVTLKTGWFITAETVEEIEAKKTVVKGRIRGKNKKAAEEANTEEKEEVPEAK